MSKYVRAFYILSEMAPPTKIASGPPSPTNSGQERRAREFWNSQSQKQRHPQAQELPPLASRNNISMSR